MNKVLRDVIVQEITPLLRAETTLWVAFSGGVDSTVLLSAVSTAGFAVPVRVIHVNHQLSLQSGQWQSHCEKVAQQMGVELVCHSVVVKNNGRGIEENARECRYRIFENSLQPNDLLLTAHHLGDQAETLLYRLLRGSGLRGLRGITKKRKLGLGWLCRPLLSVSKEQVLAYAQQHQLVWVEDESNTNTHYDRNFIRHDILPLMKKRWPQAAEKIVSASRWLSEADEVLAEYAARDLHNCDLNKERAGESIALNIFADYSYARQKHVLRYWCERSGFTAPENAQLEKLKEILNAREDASPMLRWGEAQLRRHRQRLFLLRQAPPFHPVVLTWNGQGRLELPGGGALSMKTPPATDLTLSIDFRQGGERCRPHGRAHSQSLKKLLQEFNLEPWLRYRVPIIYCDGDIAAVAGVFVCEGYAGLLTGLMWDAEA